MKRKIKIILIAAMFCLLIISLSACSTDTKTAKGERIAVGDTVTLHILDKFGIDVIGVPEGAEKVNQKYADKNKYIRIGNAMKLYNEDIYMLNPSEFIMSDATENAFGNIEQPLINLGIKTKFVSYNSIPDLKQTILDLGNYFDKKHKAKNLINDLNSKEKNIKDKIASMDSKPKVMVLFGAPMGSAKESISVETNNMYGGSLISYIGGINVANEAFPNEKRGMFKPNDWENLFDNQPDYIFCIAHGRPKEVWPMYDSVWEKLPYSKFDAVRQGKVFYLPSDIINVIANFNYINSLQYILNIFDGKIQPYYG